MSRKWLPLLAAVALVAAFFWLNAGAWDGYFQDDEFDNIGWAPHLTLRDYVPLLLKPTFDTNNFRPVGHAYFTVMGRMFGSDFPPYITPILLIHLLNCGLLFALLRRMGAGVWHALAGAAFFGFSAAAMDAYWKPMYVFDLLCTTFSLASILLFANGRWVLSFLAFWLAYKAKELAVMLPLVLFAWEALLGRRRFLVLLPFFLVSLSFGIQGLLWNPNKDNEYTFRFTFEALRTTAPFYAGRLFQARWSGLLLLPLLALRDKRIWFALFAMACFLFTLLFLPGRLFEAYFYLPLACASIALAIASTRVRPEWAWAFLAVWSLFNVPHLRSQQKRKLAQDDIIYAFVNPIQEWAVRNPSVSTLVFEAPPIDFHRWGTEGAWKNAHPSMAVRAFDRDSKEGTEAMATGTVALAAWDPVKHRTVVRIHSPQ